MSDPSNPKTRPPSPRSRTRTRVAEGIRRDKYGYEAYVHVGGQQVTQRYPPGTSLRIMQRWRQVTTEAIRQTKPAVRSGTLAADVELYLKTLADRPRLQAERTVQLAWWCTKFGTRARFSLKRGELAAALAELAATPFVRFKGKPPVQRSASSVRHYRTALFHLFTKLDGKNAPNPLKDVPPPAQPTPEARAIPYDLIDAIIDVMPDRGRAKRHGTRPAASQAKARLRVMAYVGLPPAQIAKLTPEHVDWTGRSVLVEGRRKGKGTRAQRLPLTQRGVDALRALFAAGAVGPFSPSAVRTSFLRGVEAYCAALAKTDAARARDVREQLRRARPYDLRHSFLTSVYLTSKDIRATQAFGLHADSRQTERYTLAAVSPRLLEVATQLDAVPAPAPEPPTTPEPPAAPGNVVPFARRARSKG